MRLHHLFSCSQAPPTDGYTLQAGYTCEEECAHPTWIPAISMVEMAYTPVDFKGGMGCANPSGVEDPFDNSAVNVKWYGAGPNGNEFACSEQIPLGKGATCSDGFYDIEHLNVKTVGNTCVSLNADSIRGDDGMGNHGGKRKPPPASKLCAKR